MKINIQKEQTFKPPKTDLPRYLCLSNNGERYFESHEIRDIFDAYGWFDNAEFECTEARWMRIVVDTQNKRVDWFDNLSSPDICQKTLEEFEQLIADGHLDPDDYMYEEDMRL